MESQIKEIARTHNIRLCNMTDIRLGYRVEIAEKMIMQSGMNPCVPTKNGKSIYQGCITNFVAKSFDIALNKALKFIEENK